MADLNESVGGRFNQRYVDLGTVDSSNGLNNYALGTAVVEGVSSGNEGALTLLPPAIYTATQTINVVNEDATAAYFFFNFTDLSGRTFQFELDVLDELSGVYIRAFLLTAMGTVGLHAYPVGPAMGTRDSSAATNWRSAVPFRLPRSYRVLVVHSSSGGTPAYSVSVSHLR
jgi:hypothetical protein